jgi:hypothetical protein
VADEALDRDLEQMTGSPVLAKHLKQSLRRLVDGAAGPRLAEVAREALDGRTALRDMAKSSAYADYFTDAIAGFHRWQAELTPAEREQYLDEVRQRLLGENEGNAVEGLF